MADAVKNSLFSLADLPLQSDAWAKPALAGQLEIILDSEIDEAFHSGAGRTFRFRPGAERERAAYKSALKTRRPLI